ncbi:cytochrome-c oxidase [Maritimibacter sp. 55A14]|uniref:cytochrome-c oxidase n=1 Tax=Maritimibacter sp. 55A14 TaxID=2174844 RepID=UPI000D61F73B|nr:cytochrome-c oxidase [Maritimibacter sp. 55A14]PWE29861.1 cytochrome-c oxidase [Maritimibacter sp. 55A14]
MKRLLFAVLLLVLPALQAAAHHPGERIDEVMAEREPAFEPTDPGRAPRLRGAGADNAPLRLAGLQERIVVVSFALQDCGTLCAAQQALLREVQAGVNVTPMRERTIFPTVGPATDEGWDDENWLRLAAEDGAAEAASAFAALSDRGGNAPTVHVIDRGGRHSAIFHGADFTRVNLILYINELTNAPPPDPGWLDCILAVFQ